LVAKDKAAANRKAFVPEGNKFMPAPLSDS
jgi:hypothetical protein